MKNTIILIFFILLSACSFSKKVIQTKKPEIIKVEPKKEVLSYYDNNSTMNFVAESIRIANCATKNLNFHRDILAVKNYTHYSGSNQHIVKQLLSPTKADVGTYYKKFTRARAYRNIGSNKVWLNRANIKYSDVGLLDTLIHERLHVLGFGHKGNNRYAYNNEQSVPYKVGFLSRKYYRICK